MNKIHNSDSKNKEKEANFASVFPKPEELGRIYIETRHLAYFLPVAFLAIWIALLLVSLSNVGLQQATSTTNSTLIDQLVPTK